MAQLKSDDINNLKKPQPASRTKEPAPHVKIRSRGGRPTKKAVEALEKRILDVAAHLFSTQGFAATTMEQVATECQAGKDTIYRRYASKRELFEALVKRAHREVLLELERVAATPGKPLEVLRNFARAILEVNMRPELSAIHRVALSEAMPTGGVVNAQTKDDPIMVLFASLFRAAQDDGVLIAGDSFEIAEQLLYATSIKPMLSAMMGRTEYVDQAAQDLYFDVAWSLFLSGAKS